MPDSISTGPRRRRLFAIAALILTAQAVLSYGLSRVEYLPAPPAFQDFPLAVGSWQRLQDGVVEPEALAVLAPDDVLNRFYQDAQSSQQASLFVAYYRTQHRAKIAHDPKVCLPGAGWEPKISHVIDIRISAAAQPIKVNYYVISKGAEQNVVLYWFQTHKRVIAQEQILRAYRVFDTITDNRTDMALVRVITAVREDGLAAATARAVQFAQSLYPLLLPYFPAKA